MNAPVVEKKKQLHPALLVALLVVAALSAWSMFGDDDTGDAAASRQAQGERSGPGGARGEGVDDAHDASALRQAQGERVGAGGGEGTGGGEGAAGGEASAHDPRHLRSALQKAMVLLDDRPAFPALSVGGGKAWASVLPPPPPPPKNLPPPPPQAPPFPYQLVGRWQEDEPAAAPQGAFSVSSASTVASPGSAASAVAAGVQMAVVAGPLTTWVVKPGDVIQGQWRVDAIDGSQMRVTYLPLSQSQTVGMRPSS